MALPTLPPTLDLPITRLGGLGDGMGMWKNLSASVPKTLPGDVVRLHAPFLREGMLQAEEYERIADSPERAVPPCPHFEACGGCALQHLHEEAYRNFKRTTLSEALRKAGYAEAKGEVHFLPAPTRRRVEFTVTRNGDGMPQLALHRPRSRELTPVSTCLILTPALQQLIPRLNAALAESDGGITGAQLTEAANGIDVTFEGNAPAAEELAAALHHEASIIRFGVNTLRGYRILAERHPPDIQIGDVRVPLPPGGFLQAAGEGQTLLAGFVTQHMHGAARVLDLFAGLGTYSIPLCAQASVTAAEGEAALVEALAASAKRHGLPLKALRRDLFAAPFSAAELKAYDAIVINPPRAGAKAQVAEIARSGAKRVVMVSCNPATFARDARMLKDAGFRLESAIGVDQFVWSAHLEIAAAFKIPA